MYASIISFGLFHDEITVVHAVEGRVEVKIADCNELQSRILVGLHIPEKFHIIERIHHPMF